MKICVIGLGYLGATHSVAMAKLGYEVIGIEPDTSRLSALQAGELPFYEPGLDEALTEVLEAGKLSFQAAHDEKSAECGIHFLCVGTPQLAGSNAADTSYVFSAARELAAVISKDAVVAGKSTVPVGTALRLKEEMSEIAGFEVNLAWNPEFLREGTALEDSLKPDRIIVGSWNEHSVEMLRDVYKPIINSGTPFITMDVATAELVKVAANSFLATKISFINAMAEVAEVSGADTVALAEAIGYDERIGKKFLRNGVGFGGGCLPKDIRGFIARAEELGVGSAVDFLKDVDQVNLRRRDRLVELSTQELGDVMGKQVLVLGISFKPDSDDLRDSPSLDVALRLEALGAKVRVHDPMALGALGDRHSQLEKIDDLKDGFRNAELVILGTEWAEYQSLDPATIGELVANKLIIDGRNVLNVAVWQQAGWRLIALGRNVHK